MSKVIARAMGLHFPPARWADLERGVGAAAKASGFADVASYARRLVAAPLERPQLQLLASHLTIGETYFFRDPQLMKAVTSAILPELIRERRGGKQELRVWSAGCASGEEAYSLAILLEQLVPDLAHWRASVTGTDINPVALDKARAGVYGDWSFRDVPPAVKASYFEQGANGHYAVVPRIRKLVSFGYLNLAHDAAPPADAASGPIDLIFCRNVLMYLTPRHARAAIARLHAALGDGGWLVVSPCETSQTLFAQFECVNLPGAIVYRKSARSAQVAMPVMPAIPAAIRRKEPAPSPPPAPAATIVSRPAPAAPPRADAQSLSALARSLANQGRLADARACCERWVSADKINPAAYYLQATVLTELGEVADARSALRRALYVDANFVMAHVALGHLCRRAGLDADAEKHFLNALRLLDRLEPDQPLAEGDGLIASRLAAMIGEFMRPQHIR
ncbi:MAG TPA: CheR family methyltransferase [Ramlibacter sp.]|nr:CheR family methyltransferase [Ramlibacter sp.]